MASVQFVNTNFIPVTPKPLEGRRSPRLAEQAAKTPFIKATEGDKTIPTVVNAILNHISVLDGNSISNYKDLKDYAHHDHLSQDLGTVNLKPLEENIEWLAYQQKYNPQVWNLHRSKRLPSLIRRNVKIFSQESLKTLNALERHSYSDNTEQQNRFQMLICKHALALRAFIKCMTDSENRPLAFGSKSTQLTVEQ